MIKDYINYAESFSTISDFIILSDKDKFDYNILKKDAIIFCKTDYINFLFNNIRFSKHKYILITHYSDYPIDAVKFANRPKCIKKWYGYCVTHDDKDLNHIPTGVCPHWALPPPWERNKVFDKWFIENMDRLASKDKNPSVMYCNYTMDEYRPKRDDIKDKLAANGVLSYSPTRRLMFDEYCEEMSEYQFVISPPGNGIDAHRNWECFYIGCIPIVIKNRIYKNYNLPFCFVNDYSEVTHDLLTDFLSYYKKHKYNYAPLHLEYWKQKLRNELESL